PRDPPARHGEDPHRRAAGPRRGSGLRHVAGGLLGAAAEQELLHLALEEGAVLGVERREPVLVDEHGLVAEPRRPSGLADAREHALAELAGPGHEVEALGLALFVLAVDGSAHGRSSRWGAGASSSVRTGAGMPSAASSAREAQR